MKEILREIGTIARALDSISNIEFKEIHLTKGQYLYLIRICEHPGNIQEKIAELLRVDRTTAARAIKKLESQGFIYKEEDPTNRKIKKLYPTDRGQEIYQFLMRENDHSEQTALEGLSTEEITTLFRLLKQVSSNIEEDWNEVKKGNKRDY